MEGTREENTRHKKENPMSKKQGTRNKIQGCKRRKSKKRTRLTLNP